MAKVLISYFSKSGNTEKVAESIKEGLESVDSIDVVLKKVQETTLDDLTSSDGIIIGSPTYFGGMAAEVKELIDKSVKIYGKLNGKVGGAFTSAGGIGCGSETTVLGVLKAFLIHGMIIQGDQIYNHYGPVAINTPDEKVHKTGIRYGKLLGELVLKIRQK
ncbi:MAG: flavodoxin family protein [Candidatus Hermodarchaeota archaeon]